jgi:tetratricopeptide (TPR) repeat protein
MSLRAAILVITATAMLGFAYANAQESGAELRLSRQSTTTDSPSAHNSPDLDAINHLVQLSRLQEAEASLRQFLSQHQDSADGHYLLGLVLFREIQMGASHESNTLGAQYNDLNPSLAQLAKTNAEASLAEYTAGARYRKPTAADLKIVALDYVILGDFTDADKWLTRALEWNPQDAEAWYHLGRTKYNLNRFEEGVHAFKECLKLDPGNIKAEDNLGLCYEGLSKTDDAIAAYRQAIAWQEQSSHAEPFAGPKLDLGSLLLDQNQPQQALPYLQQAAEISPRESRIHEKLGKTYTDLNQLAEAQQEFEKAVALSPENPRLHFMLGQIYRKQGLMEKAKAELDRSAALNGTHSTN